MLSVVEFRKSFLIYSLRGLFFLEIFVQNNDRIPFIYLDII